MTDTKTKTNCPAGELAKRDAAGKLQKGHSMGRPSGSSERDLTRAEALPHRSNAIAVLAAAVEQGLALGKEIDQATVKAAIELLDRIAAKPKPQDERVVIPGLKEARDLDAKCAAVVAAVADGAVSVNAGRAALAMIADLARVLEVTEHEKRIAELERQTGLARKVIDNGPLV